MIISLSHQNIIFDNKPVLIKRLPEEILRQVNLGFNDTLYIYDDFAFRIISTEGKTELYSSLPINISDHEGKNLISY